jgi:hypothetical protein
MSSPKFPPFRRRPVIKCGGEVYVNSYRKLRLFEAKSVESRVECPADQWGHVMGRRRHDSRGTCGKMLDGQLFLWITSDISIVVA